MRKKTSLSTIEIWVLILAAVFFVMGMVWMVNPRATAEVHPAVSIIGYQAETVIFPVDAEQWFFYGVATTLFGLGLAAVVLYGARK